MRARLAKFRQSTRARWQRATAQPLFCAALWACAGILLSDLVPLPFAVWPGIAVLSAAVFCLRRTRLWLLVMCAAVFGLAHRFDSADPLREALERRVAEGAGLPATVTGIVRDAPEDEYRPASWRFPLEIESIATGGTALPARRAVVSVSAAEMPVAPRYGDRVELRGLLVRPAHPRNPGEFDYPTWLRRSGISAEFEVFGQARMRVISGGHGWGIYEAAIAAREWIGSIVTEDITDTPEIAATVRTMVLGTRERTPQEVEDAFVASGAMHIFAVSGLHVVLFAGILHLVMGILRVRGWPATAVVLGITFFYVFITGLRPSAWRAAIMLTAVLAGTMFDRKSSMLNSLGFAALLLLGCDTQEIFLPGFSLSFGVLLAIAAITGPLVNWAQPWWRHDVFVPEQMLSGRQRLLQTCRKWLCASLATSLASTAGTIPIMVPYFNMITPVGILANLVLIGLSMAILAVACAALVTFWYPPLLWCWNQCNWVLATVSIVCAKFFAAIPYGHIRADFSRMFRGSPCEVTVLALEDGGGATHIDTPDGRHWLIDTGGVRHFVRTMRPHLVRSAVNRLDGVILSHRDAYHTGAAQPLAAFFKPGSVMHSPAESFNNGAGTVQAGDRLNLDNGGVMEVLFPPPGWRAGPGDDRCMVLRLEYRGRRILFMNDAGFITEKYLLESGQDLRADVLVKGRHGSDFSGLPEFLNAVQPQAVVFTHCRFPSSERVPPSWTAMLEAKGIAAFDQSTEGAVIVRMENGAMAVRGWFSGREMRLK